MFALKSSIVHLCFLQMQGAEVKCVAPSINTKIHQQLIRVGLNPI
jgi:hypothetical protein